MAGAAGPVTMAPSRILCRGLASLAAREAGLACLVSATTARQAQSRISCWSSVSTVGRANTTPMALPVSSASGRVFGPSTVSSALSARTGRSQTKMVGRTVARCVKMDGQDSSGSVGHARLVGNHRQIILSVKAAQPEPSAHPASRVVCARLDVHPTREIPAAICVRVAGGVPAALLVVRTAGRCQNPFRQGTGAHAHLGPTRL